MRGGPSFPLSGAAGRLFVFLTLVGGASAATLVTTTTRDTTLYFDLAGSTGNGAGPTVFAGTTAGGAARRALLAFDLAAIPAGSVVESVTLRLFLTQAQNLVAPVTVHRVTTHWGEGVSNAGIRGGAGTGATPGDATWRHAFYPGQEWSVPGGDFEPVALASASVGAEGIFYSWDATPAFLADVQRAVDDPASHLGWMLRGDETASGTAKAFASRETSDPAHRPELTVVYAPVPEPAGLGMVGGLFLAAVLVRRYRKRADPRTA